MNAAEREFTVRVCSSCGALYVWLKGEHRPGRQCPRCLPEPEGLPFEFAALPAARGPRADS